MSAQAPRPRQAAGANAAAGPSSRSAIHLPSAYDRFDNLKRNRWIDELQRKIRDGLNGPVSPGPSRSPSPLLDRQDGIDEQDVFADIGAAAEDGLLRDEGHTLEVQVNGYHEESEEEEDEGEDEGIVGSGGLDEEYEEDQLMSGPLEEEVLPDQDYLDGEYADDASQGEEEEEVDYEDELDEGDEADGGERGLHVPVEPQEVEFIGSSDEEDQADQDESDDEDNDEEEEEQDQQELEEEQYDEGFPPTMSETLQENQASPFPPVSTDPREVAPSASSLSSLYPTLPPHQPLTMDPRHMEQPSVPPRDAAISPVSSSSDWPTTSGFGVPTEMIDPELLQQLAQEAEAERTSNRLYPDLPPAVSAGALEGNAEAVPASYGTLPGHEEMDYRMGDAEEETVAGGELPLPPLYVEEENQVFPSEEQEVVEEEEEEEDEEEEEEDEEEEPLEQDDEHEYSDGSGLRQAFGNQVRPLPRGPSHGPTPEDEVIEVLSSSSDDENPDEDDEDNQREPEFSEQEEDELEEEEDDAFARRKTGRTGHEPLEEYQLEHDEDEEMEDQDMMAGSSRPYRPQAIPPALETDHVAARVDLPAAGSEDTSSPAYKDDVGLPPFVQPDSSTFDEPSAHGTVPVAKHLGLPPVVQQVSEEITMVEPESEEQANVDQLGSSPVIQSLPQHPYLATHDLDLNLDPRLVAASQPLPDRYDQQVPVPADEGYESEATPEPVDPSFIAKALGDDVEEDGADRDGAGYDRHVITEDIEIEEIQGEDGSRETLSRTIVQEVFEPLSQPITPLESSLQMDFEELQDLEDLSAEQQRSLAADNLADDTHDAPAEVAPVEDITMDVDSTTVHAVSIAIGSTGGSTDAQAESATAASAEVGTGFGATSEGPEADADHDMVTEEAGAALPDPYVPPRDTSMPIPFLLRTPRTSPSPSASVVVAASEAPAPISTVSELEAPRPMEREHTPVDMPNPHEPPPDTKMPSPRVPLRSVSRATPTPSLIVEPPFNPPKPSSVEVQHEPREETPPELPDPSLPPPPLDADRFSPLQASDFMDTHYSPTGSLVAEPPDQTPLPSAAVFDPNTNREETPTPLPDPQAAVPDTDLEPPLTPHQMKPSLITPSPSMIVEAPDETPWASKAGTVNEGSVDTPRASRGAQEPVEVKRPVTDEAMEGNVKPSPSRRSTRLQSSPVEHTNIAESAEPAGPGESTATRLRHQHGPKTAAPPAVTTRTRSFHLTPTPTPDPEAASSPHLTRSQCFYRKLHLVEDDFDAVVLVPQCTVGDEKLLEEEKAENLGEPSVMEQAEGLVRPITANNPHLDDPLNSKLHRIVGAQIVNEGHCYLLSASDSALLPPKEEEDAETTPTLGSMRGKGSARRARRSSSKHDPISKHTPSPGASPLLAPRQTRASARKSGISVEPESLGRPSASPRLGHRARRSISQASMTDSPGDTLKRSLRRSTSAVLGNTDSPARHTRSQGPAPVEDNPSESSESQPTPRAQDSPARHTRSHVSPSATPTPESPPQKRTRRGRGSSTGVARARGADSLGFIKTETEEVDELDSIPRGEADIDIDVKVETTPSGKARKGRRSIARTTDNEPYRPAEESEAESAGETEVKSEEEEAKPSKGKGRARNAKADSVPLDDALAETAETDAETDIVWEETVPSPKVTRRKSRRSLAAMKDNAAFKYDPSATATPDESDLDMDDEDSPAPERLLKGKKRKSRASLMDRQASSLWKDTTAVDDDGEISVGVETRSTKRRAVDDTKLPGSPVVAIPKDGPSGQAGARTEEVVPKKKGKKGWWPFGR